MFSLEWMNASLQPFYILWKHCPFCYVNSSHLIPIGLWVHCTKSVIVSFHHILAPPPTVPDYKTASVPHSRLVFSHISVKKKNNKIKFKTKKKPSHPFNVPLEYGKLQIFLAVLQSIYSTWLKWKLLNTSRASELVIVRKKTTFLKLCLFLTSLASKGRVKCCLKLFYFQGVSTLMQLLTACFSTAGPSFVAPFPLLSCNIYWSFNSSMLFCTIGAFYCLCSKQPGKPGQPR